MIEKCTTIKNLVIGYLKPCNKVHYTYMGLLTAYDLHNMNESKFYKYAYVTEFAKRGLIHASNFSTLRMYNSASIGPTALKFGNNSFPSLC